MRYVYTIEYYSDIKRNNIGPFVETWVNLESIIQCEVDPEREKQILYTNTFMWTLKSTIFTVKSHLTKSTLITIEIM